MAARDNAASVQGEVIRITPLLTDGNIDPSQPILTTDGFISASFGTEFEDGDEISEKAANGKICIQYKVDDSLTGITFNLSLCSPDPEAAALIAGGMVIMDATGEVVGYTSPAVGDLVGKPIAVEIWSKAIINGKPAQGTPYWHWVFPYVRVRYEGDREFTNGALVNEYSGTGVGNEALGCPAPPGGLPGDFTTYADALNNPFSYVRTATLPAVGWSSPTWEGGGLGPDCTVVAPENLATGATENVGAAGVWTPTGAVVPGNLAQMSDPTVITATPNTLWSAGSHMLLGDSSQTHWNGTAWVVGASPAVATPATGATEVVGGEGTWTPSGSLTPVDLAAMSSVTANPISAWGAGSQMTLGDASTAHWDGSAWVSGPGLF